METSLIYEQIINDLTEAQALLSENYSYSNGERIRPNRWAATSLLSRVHLYKEDWDNAEMYATEVINNKSTYNLESDLNAIYLKNSVEAIWQLKPVEPGINTNEGNIFIFTSNPNSVALTNQLVNSFEQMDLRRISWIDSVTIDTKTYYYPNKYKVKSGETLEEYSMVLRLAELYLIRSEARAQKNSLEDAVKDLDAIRERAGLPLISSTNPMISKAELLLTIEQERKVEFFTEWGHRWLDLKRTMRANPILVPIKGSDWQPTDALYPIPDSEIETNSNLSQNDGY